MAPVLWTVGHSNHDFDAFAGLLSGERIAFLIDVRSFPYSRFAPQFNREELRADIGKRGVRYVFLGDALGGRPEREEHYDAEGHALYDLMAQERTFRQGVDRVLRGARDHRLALLCSCGNPRDCHRRLLVGKVLCERGAELRHILPDGRVESERMVTLGDPIDQHSLFGNTPRPWRSAQSVSHRRRRKASSGV